jgi:hypothetical protein
MKDAIVKKGNLSASGLDKLTYPILKYEKDEAADLMVKIMTMFKGYKSVRSHGKRARW